MCGGVSGAELHGEPQGAQVCGVDLLPAGRPVRVLQKVRCLWASGVENRRSSIVFWAFVLSNTRSPGASCAFFFQTNSFREEFIN